MKKNRFSPFLDKTWGGALTVLALTLLVGWQVDRWCKNWFLTQKHESVLSELIPSGNALSAALNQRFAILKGLAAFARTHPTEAELQADFTTFAASLHEGAPGVRALQLFPPRARMHTFPVAGNEAVLGRTLENLINDPRSGVGADVKRAISSGQIALSGPYELRQGGAGLVARLAVHLDGDFWGLAVLVLDLPALLAEAGLDHPSRKIDLALREEGDEVFFGKESVFRDSPVIYPVTLPDRTWILAAVPHQGWQSSIAPPLRLVRVIELITLLLSAGLTYSVISRRTHLEQTVRERTEALTESRERYRELFEHNSDALFVVGPDGNILDANSIAISRYGYERQELLGLTILDLVAPECRAQVPSRLKKALAEGVQFEFRHRRKDGSEFPVEVNSRPIVLGGERCLLSSVRDITERQQAEKELRERSEIIRLTIEATRLGIWDWNMTADLWTATPSYFRMLGYDPETDGQDREVWGERTHPDDRGFVVDKMIEVRDEGLPGFDIEFRFRHADGSYRWINSIGSAIEFDASGRAKRMLGLQIDITERKRQEQELQRYNQRLTLLRDIDQHILVARSTEEVAEAVLKNIRGLIPFWRATFLLFDNQAHEAVIYASVSEADSQIQTGSRIPLVPTPLYERLKAGQIILVTDAACLEEPVNPALRRVIQEGMRSMISAPLIVEGATVGALSLLSDEVGFFTAEHQQVLEEISNQLTIALHQAELNEQIQRHNAELEQRVAKRTAQLEAANKELEAFTYSVSHDLRAPLRAINGFSRIVLEESANLSAETSRYLQLIADNGLQMARLIEDLLDFSRLGRKPLQREPLNMEALVRRCLEELAEERQGREIEIVLGELPDCEADPQLLRQVILNLLANAIKYTRLREKAVIEVGSVKRNGDTVYFVRDNGVGFDMRFADKLFGVFQRLHRAEDFEGTGVGLALAKRIVQRHDGSVWAEAEVDKGATFYFNLRIP